MEGIPDEERTDAFGIDYPVSVYFGRSHPSCVKILGCNLKRSDSDIMGEERIHRPKEIILCESKVGLEIGDLSQGMHARIGSACSQDGNIFSGDLGQGFFKKALDGLFLWLSLPAVVVRSIITDFDLVVLEHFVSLVLPNFREISRPSGGQLTTSRDKRSVFPSGFPENPLARKLLSISSMRLFSSINGEREIKDRGKEVS